MIRSDELNCTSIKPRTHTNYTFTDHECSHPDRTCTVNGNCIRVDQLCDGKTDCPDGKSCWTFSWITNHLLKQLLPFARFGWRTNVRRKIMWSESRVQSLLPQCTRGLCVLVPIAFVFETKRIGLHDGAHLHRMGHMLASVRTNRQAIQV